MLRIGQGTFIVWVSLIGLVAAFFVKTVVTPYFEDQKQCQLEIYDINNTLYVYNEIDFFLSTHNKCYFLTDSESKTLIKCTHVDKNTITMQIWTQLPLTTPIAYLINTE